jgi:hypothetical protein
MDQPGSCTLVFYRLNSDWRKEPLLNLLAAYAQGSDFSHVEIAIGSDAGKGGEMTNVLRVFAGELVELVSRTGRNPSFSYVQLGCSKQQENRMLRHAQSLVGRPFSMMAMVRSVVFPRTTDGSSFFCAELVASALQAGGLLSGQSNPGAATPQSLHEVYAKRAAATANPFILAGGSPPASLSLQPRAHAKTVEIAQALAGAHGGRGVGALRVVAARRDEQPGPISISLASLDMRRSLLERR